MDNKIVSFDIKADFGFLKKPDTNEPVYLTFNMLHKPALLGILGAILGLEGFQENEKLPAYYKALKELKVGVKPLRDEKGNFQKTVIRYSNSVGYANLDGGTLIVDEQTLIAPGYRCYLLLNLENELHKKLRERLKNHEAEYLPYLGKNDFSLWWEEVKEWDFESFQSDSSFHVDTIFIKEQPVKEGRTKSTFDLATGWEGGSFMYFENLPVAYHTELYQYEYKPFGYTDWKLKEKYKVNDLYKLKDNDKVVQLF
ncbi:MAG: type I-B CRISPR-associated protein Cas5b [Balneolaceae bacterium]